MPDRAQLPPPAKMIPELRAADHTWQFYREVVARDSPRFVDLNPIPRGTPYAVGKGADPRIVSDLPTLFFVRQTVPIGSNTIAGMTQDLFVIWEWSTAPDAENVENAEISYSGEAVANPVYARVSTVRRSTYEITPTLTPGTATFTGLIGIKVTGGGTGYTTAPTVAISGSLGASAEAVITAAGVVSHVVITAEGSGYNSASLPTISFSGGGGTGAAATAIVQPVAAVLTSQRKREFPEDSPFAKEFVQVLRTFEVLPGPLLPFTRYDDDLGPVAGTRQAVLWASQAAAITATTKTTYEAREGSSVVAWKLVETWSDGTGSGSNPAYPILKTDFYDDERGAVHQTSQITTDTTTAGSLTAPSTTAIKTRFEPYKENPALRVKLIETWTVPGPIQTSTEFERDGIKKVVTRQMRKVGDLSTTEELVAEDKIERYFIERLNEVLAFQIFETITIDSDALLDLPVLTISIPNVIPEIFRAQIPTHVESHIVEGTAEETTLVDYEFEHSERQLTPLYKEVRSTMLTAPNLPTSFVGKETNDKKQVVTVTMTLESEEATPTVPTALIDVDFKKLGNGLAIEITKTISAVFDATVFAKQRQDAVPERFKKATPEITEKHLTAGTAAAPSLSSGDTSKSEQQKDAFVKETSVTNKAVGAYPTLNGQTYDQSLDIVIPYTEDVGAAGSSIGANRIEVTPLGTDIYGNRVEIAKAIDFTALETALDDYLAEFPGTTNLVLPDILESVEVIWNEGTGEGSFDSEWEGYTSGTSGSLGGSEAGNAQGSASLMPELAIKIKQTWAKNLPTTRSFFFLPLPITISDILGKVSAIASWPVFKPEGHTIVLHGMKVAVDAKAQGAASVAFSDSSQSWDRSEGSGTSEDVNVMVSAVTIPPTIHATINFSDVDRTLDAVANATASWVGYNFPSINATATATKTASAFIWPESIAATTPAVIPSSGIYLIDSHVEIYGYGYGKCYAETLDASLLA